MKKSQWIWCQGQDPTEYNQTVVFEKTFDCKRSENACLSVVADSWYRVFLNGVWIQDGPARAYPERMLFDRHDCTEALKDGLNKIEVIVRYFGCGTFHQIPAQGGLRLELSAGETVIGTDETWSAAASPHWKQWTPKISIQMEPVEAYDARCETPLAWKPARELERATVLEPRETANFTRVGRQPAQAGSLTLVEAAKGICAVPVTRIAHPGVVEANHYTSRPVVIGAVLAVKQARKYDFSSRHWKIALNGRLLDSEEVPYLQAGQHTVLFFCNSFYGHEKELPFPWFELPHAAWGGWTVAVAEHLLFLDNDLRWPAFEHKQANRVEERWEAWVQANRACWPEADAPLELPATIREIPAEQLFLRDFAADFATRVPIAARGESFLQGEIAPSPEGDWEICFDFGEQVCGYIDVEIVAEGAVDLEFNMVEHITSEGTVQHTFPQNRNGFYYGAKKGSNPYTSLKRRSGRYLFVTLRQQSAALTIQSIQLIESTAPVNAVASFKCSDSMLERAWRMSERTLQLCMEDTFTDCPLYEQTLWIGDARNEALYAFTAYESCDVSARSLELGAESLARFPIVGCQVPSAWECVLPAWSFLWGMHVWEHYFFTGDEAFLRKMWPAVVQNLAGADRLIGAHGLFAGPFWNLLEWADIDQDHEVVLHNSMLMVAALRAAEKCAEVLEETSEAVLFSKKRDKLIAAINRHWSQETDSYPDALVDEAGTPSLQISQHTSMLAIMCGVATPEIEQSALRNLLDPPQQMTRIASPFAMQFFYEALERVGEYDAIIDSIEEKFAPMVAAGASTVWEMFPGAHFETRGFPTRSHCHAWASSPLYFLNRIVLGIRPLQAGGRSFELSPWVTKCQHAKGASATPLGMIRVSWQLLSDGAMHVEIDAPQEVSVEFLRNQTHPDTIKVILRQGAMEEIRHP